MKDLASVSPGLRVASVSLAAAAKFVAGRIQAAEKSALALASLGPSRKSRTMGISANSNRQRKLYHAVSSKVADAITLSKLERGNTMINKDDRPSLWRQHPLFILAILILILSLLAGCDSSTLSTEDLEAVDYSPLPGDGWEASTPVEQGLEPMLVAELFHNASELETLYGLLVVKDGYLIAEDYFNEGSLDQKALLQSVAKSITSALVGIALDKGCISGVDQKMIDFFPDFADQLADPRKKQITIRDMLQMRAGYPAEESDSALWEAVLSGDYVHLVADIPLASDPGTEFQYSNLTAHWLGVIVARACDNGLKSFGQEFLFDPMGAEIGNWQEDLDGYNWAAGEIHVSARDTAKFGLLYLDDGQYEGKQIIPADWVRNSLQSYSDDAYDNIGPFRDLGYGYQWWSATVGEYRVNFAWGHGGQLIVLVDDLNMVVVVTADPMYEVYGSESWKHEKASFELVGDFIYSLSES